MVQLIFAILYLLHAASCNTMFPNERTTLDDCHLRYFRVEGYSIAKPISGGPTRIREFPHMAAIGWTQPDGSVLWQCGGSLVWDNFVLTAAHCVLDSRSKAPDTVRLGDIDLYSADDDQWAQQFEIVKIVRHPDYRFSANYHDIALLKLDRNVVEDGTVIPACLWTDEEVRFRRLVATGWGRTGVAEEFTPKLLQVSLKPISNEDCGKFYSANRKLKQGLQEQHLCAVDEKMDTCEGDSGGPLQFKMMHNGRMTPFIVGVTSFGSACGVSVPGVYARVSAYFEWIIATMRQNGAAGLGANYNETLCALRYVRYRELDKQIGRITDGSYLSVDRTKLRIYETTTPKQLATIRWNGQGPECYGVIVDEDTVLTVADCTFYRNKSPSFISYLNNKIMPISKILVHPEHVRGTGYKNIAILKLSNLLDLPLNFTPSCISHRYDLEGRIDGFGKGRRDINEFVNYGYNQTLEPVQKNHLIVSPIFNSGNCIVSESFNSKLGHGLTSEHLCVGNDVFLVPGSCEQLTGSMLGNSNGYFYDTVGLSLVSRDCGFGEHLIGTRLYSHVEWMKSVLLPNYRDSSAVHFVDVDLQEDSNCRLDGGLTGKCVPVERCRNQLKKSQGQVTFCSSGSVVCCSLQNMETSSRTHADILNCPKLVEKLAGGTSNGSLVNFGWISNKTLQFRCRGSVISRSSVLTTASCLGKIQPNVVQMVESKVQTGIDTVFIHPGYNSTDRTNDIALVRLKNLLSWSSSIQPICLWTNQTHTPITMDINYPTTYESDYEYTYIFPIHVNIGLQVANASKLHPMYGSDCQRTHPHVVRDSQLCTRSPYKAAVCVAPSDQLIWEDKDTKVRYLVGMSTNACDQVNWKHGLFTRVSSFLGWISENAF